MSKVSGSTAVPNTVIESSKYNAVIDDIIQDLNDARPVTSGGTGATSAANARANLGFAADIANVGVKGADIASAATTDIGAATGDYVTVTGTTTITALGTITAGVSRVVRFSGALILTHNATSLILPGGANIITAAGDVAIFRSEGSGNWRCINYERATGGTQSGPQMQGYFFGLTLSNNATDATNDIDIAVGSAAADTSPYYLMTLGSALTKQLDGAWAVGTNQGMRDTGSIADGWWYIFLIQRSGTGVTDILASLSSTAPTMPANYDRKRLIGAIFRTGGAIKAFTQFGRDFVWVDPVDDLSTTSTSTAGALVTLSVPPIDGARARLGAFLSAGGDANVWVREAAAGNIAATVSNADVGSTNAGGRNGNEMHLFVNSSGQVRYRSSVGSVGLLRITTKGFRLPN